MLSRTFKLKLVSIAAAAFLMSCQNSSNPPGEQNQGGRDASSYVRLSNRTLGQLVRYAALRPDHRACVLGIVTKVTVIESEALGLQHYLEFENASNICAHEEVSGAATGTLGRQMVAIGQSLLGNSGSEIAIGSEVFVLASTQVGTAQDPRTQTSFSFIGRAGPVFDRAADGTFMIKGEGSYFKIVEEAVLQADTLRAVVKNAIRGGLSTYDELCLAAECAMACRPQQVSADLSTSPLCSVGSCYYGADCAQVTVRGVADLCTECGDAAEEPSIIQREIDGVLHCWDAQTYQEVRCP